MFHVFFLQRYSRLLEESSSGGRSPAYFAWLLLYATTSLILLSPLVSMPFLGSPLSSSLVYIWSRRDPDTRLSFLGLLVFTAPYLPWVLMGFSLLLHGSIPKDEIMGVIVGHGEFLIFGGCDSSHSPPFKRVHRSLGLAHMHQPLIAGSLEATVFSVADVCGKDTSSMKRAC